MPDPRIVVLRERDERDRRERLRRLRERIAEMELADPPITAYPDRPSERLYSSTTAADGSLIVCGRRILPAPGAE